MTPSLTATIGRSILGIFGIIFVTAVIEILLVIGIVSIYNHGADNTTISMVVFVTVFVFVCFLLVLFRYIASTIQLDTDGITVTRYKLTGGSAQTTVEWNKVQDITTTKPNIFGTALDVGTLSFSSAGPDNSAFSLSWVDDPERWAKVMRERAEAAGPNV